MVRAEEEHETMRPCGCHTGRPCTCEMGKKAVLSETFSCGLCVNCRLNTREKTRASKRSLEPRRCLKSAEYFADLDFDRVVLRDDCVFRMRKPDWNLAEKTPLYNQLHQMRLAMVETRAISLATIDGQKRLRIKIANDLRKAEDAIKKLEPGKQATPVRKMTKKRSCVDSDAFDSYSTQLIAAETLLPDLQMRLEKANAIISLEQQNIKASAILIQRVYRGLRDRMSLKRIKIRRSLTDRVGALVDKFIVSGDFWGFILEIDADYRRFMHKIAEEEEDAATFLSNVIRQRKHDEDQMMQDWFTASALQNPLVSGIDQVKKTYTNEEGISSGSSVSQAMLQSPLVEDLMALSPNKKKDDIFPPDFPPKIIRQAMAKGFAVNEVIAVIRGLQAQRKDIEDGNLVVATLQERSPLMTNPWTSERVLRASRSSEKPRVHPIPVTKPICKHLKKVVGKRQANLFISANLLESIPGGMNAPVARLLLVAGLRCYDPGNRGEKGGFKLCGGGNSELFQSYLNTESPLVKIRTEQQTMEAVKPFLNILLENRCYTAYDILYNVRGVGELISWNIPRPLAKSIYCVIQAIQAQSSHVSRRNIVREVRVSADFERFLKTGGRKREELPSLDPKTAKKDLKSPEKTDQNAEAEASSALMQVQSRLESDVLGLPLQNISISACELLFKAAFLTDTEDPATTSTYHNFLHLLLEFQVSGDTEAMRQLIAARVVRAKAIADDHTSIFQLFGVATASDLVTNDLLQVLPENFTAT
ncbi:hypothetical protein F441_07792 [Phytophthora nicotianae CJ01A1]|uniref:Uncharacterized protein n=2 Tax=Phytophthora nicotianae TaxID=4792 RepID=W2X5A3_PHYNI|nr:hypothetical protein L915_07648 [Phytophthora nicotianae]ETP17916.1 hypothetical protein F441_07792 [Phytophthora nicotianae CJ01A1]